MKGFIGLLVAVIFVDKVASATDLFSTSNAMPTWDVFLGLDSLTQTVSSNPPVLALLASGGAAGGGGSVVTESQAYALFISGVVLASWETHAAPFGHSDADRDIVKEKFYGYFNGWKAMCGNSNDATSCQSSHWCQSNVCLPHWKQKGDFTSVEGTGAAPDGDEDAIVGMIFAVKAVAKDDPKPSWYNEVREWADASVASFMEFNTLGDATHRLLKLGSCWGGWGSNGNNPSYHSPGSFKVMRDYHLKFPAEERSYTLYPLSEWEKLINTSYDVLFGVQCPVQGMVPNWVTLEISNGMITSDGGNFSGSGTPQYEFGSEASRTIWRVALDAALYPDEAAGQSAPFLGPLLKELKGGYHVDSGQYPQHWSEDTFSSCAAPNMASNIYKFSGGWLHNVFIYSPVVSSLIVPYQDMSEAEQQELIEAAGAILAQSLPTDYYPRCWSLLGNLMVSGAVESAATVLGYDTPEVPMTSGTATMPATLPTAIPSFSSAGCCLQDLPCFLLMITIMMYWWIITVIR